MARTRRARIYLVAHTHWDREWYQPAGRFRQRLVALVDELIAGAAARDRPFLLDGQAVVLDDYLAVKPGERGKIGEMLRSGALEAGPWYVLADELIPSGEALVRNLLAGRAAVRALGAEPPRVLYCPDSFGHPAALPLLAEGFGLPLIILWRGYGGDSWPAGDVFRWRSAGGSTALVYHLAPDGYELGSSLPEDAREAGLRWEVLREAIVERATLGLALLPNGADHHALQPHLDVAIAALASAAGPTADLKRASLTAFAAALDEAARGAELPAIGDEMAGGVELRDSYGYTWTLQGTFATRAALKRRNALTERHLVRDVEPWVALATMDGAGTHRRALLQAAWKTLLLCHPHDTLCGCSIDEVGRAMAARLDDASSQGRGLRDDALLDIVGHDVVRARRSVDSWKPVVIVRNAAARARGGVAELEVLRFREHVRVGPGSAPDRDALANAPRAQAAQLPPYVLARGHIPFQSLERSVRHDRIESPIAYPYDDLVESECVVAWVPPVAGYGTSAITLDGLSATVSGATPSRGEPHAIPNLVTAGERWIDNGALHVEIDDAGAVRVDSRELGVSWASLIAFDDVGDAGDLYTHSPVGPVVTAARFIRSRLVHDGPLRGELHATWMMLVPESTTRAGRSSTARSVELHLAITLDAGAPFFRLHVWTRNECKDHRLRVIFRGGIADAEVWADAAFGPVKRAPIAEHDASAEAPPATAPLARYVTLAGKAHGVTVYSDGLAEYEATSGGDIAVTLVRAVGALSRNDLPERPGHAGWPAPTPEAQALGALEARFAVLPHGTRNEATIALVERTADDVLLPLQGTTLRSALTLPVPTMGVELELQDEAEGVAGLVAFAACKPAEEGEGILLRCFNLAGRSIRARWRLGVPISEALLVRLDETPIAALETDGSTIAFESAPNGVTSIIARAAISRSTD
jgi:alpha-mannosidase